MNHFRAKSGTIRTDTRSTTTSVGEIFRLPIYTSTSLPPAQAYGTGGGLAYNLTTQKPIYSTGTQWLNFGGGSGSDILGFNVFLLSSYSVPPSTPSTVSNLSAFPSPPFTSVPGLSLASGIYTASTQTTLSINVGITWAAGVSNQGTRTVRIIYDNGSQIVMKEDSTQADPNTAIETTQTLSATILMQAGNTVYVTVEHTAPVPLTIAGGVKTVISGLEIT